MPTEVQIYSNGTILTEDIANSAVTTAKIADGNVTTAKIADSAVTTAKIADASVTAAKLATGAAIPTGVIVMWSGTVATIPTGWALCDGSNNTPDLRDRFIVGAGSGYNPGNTGGANAVTLTTTQMPSHNHSASTSENGSHTHGTSTGQSWAMRDNRGLDSAYGGQGIGQGDMNAAGGHQHTITVASEGGGQAHENRPPYYALAYIMKT